MASIYEWSIAEKERFPTYESVTGESSGLRAQEELCRFIVFHPTATCNNATSVILPITSYSTFL